MAKIKTLELAHTFKLGTKYSAALAATFKSGGAKSDNQNPYLMGCYGIGVGRLLQASIDCNRSCKNSDAESSDEIRWELILIIFQRFLPSLTYSIAYFFTYLLNYLLTYLLMYLFTWLTYLFTDLLTELLTSELLTYLFT